MIHPGGGGCPARGARRPRPPARRHALLARARRRVRHRRRHVPRPGARAGEDGRFHVRRGVEGMDGAERGERDRGAAVPPGVGGSRHRLRPRMEGHRQSREHGGGARRRRPHARRPAAPDMPTRSPAERPYDVITFDCYGTLIDWEHGIRTALSALADDVAPDHRRGGAPSRSTSRSRPASRPRPTSPTAACSPKPRGGSRRGSAGGSPPGARRLPRRQRARLAAVCRHQSGAPAPRRRPATSSASCPTSTMPCSPGPAATSPPPSRSW